MDPTNNNSSDESSLEDYSSEDDVASDDEYGTGLMSFACTLRTLEYPRKTTHVNAIFT
jgi:hypothetical protein